MNRLLELLKRRWDIVSYIFFGVCSTVISWGTYSLCLIIFDGLGMNGGVNIVISNIISWIFAVAFAFITNKLWVFGSKSFEAGTLWYEIWTFLSARLVTLLVETGILLLASVIFGSDNTAVNMVMKIFANVVVVVLNYIFSKLIIFRKRGD